MTDLCDTELKMLLFFCHKRLAHIQHVLYQFRQAELLRHQGNLAAFDSRHIKDLIDQAEKMPAWSIYFIQTVFYFFRRVDIRLCDSGHSHNGIHRRTDVMRHGWQKIGFGRARHPRGLIGFFQCLTLPRLLFPFLCHIDTHTVKWFDTIPAVFTAHIAQSNHQNLYFSGTGNNTGFYNGILSRLFRPSHHLQRAGNIFRIHIGHLRMKLLFKLLLRVAYNIKEIPAKPKNCPHIPRIHPHQPAGNRTQNSFPIQFLFGKLKFQAVVVMGHFKTGLTPFPVNNTILNHVCPL